MRVEFRVPVWVHVDVEHGEIVSVHVDDTAVDGPVGFSTYWRGEPDSRSRRAAAELTSDDTAWPHWTIGFDHS